MIEFKREKALNRSVTKSVSNYVKRLNFSTSTTYRYMSSICAFLSTCENPHNPTAEDFAKFYKKALEDYPQYRIEYTMPCVQRYMRDVHGIYFKKIEDNNNN